MYMKYGEYFGSINKEEEIYWGKLILISDSVTYESLTLKGLKKEFIFAVIDYVADCKGLLDKEPEVPDIVEVDL